MPPRRLPSEHTIQSLIERRQALLIVCASPCNTQRYLTPLEAVATYGGGIGFRELTKLLQERCGGHCNLQAEPSARKPDELVVKRRNGTNLP